MLQREPHRVPATPGYPIQADHARQRREFLKLCALGSAAAALGLPLLGCPRAGGPPPPPPPPPTPTPTPEPWLHPAGAPPARVQMVAVVIGGEPIAVEFQDGARARVVVAGTVQDFTAADGPAAFARQVEAHAALVREEAARVAGATLGDPEALHRLEAAIRERLQATLPPGVLLSEVGLAEAREPEAPAEDRAPQAPRAPAPSAPRAPAPAPAAEEAGARSAPAPAAAPARAVLPQRLGLPEGTTLWRPCGRPGCTSCGGE